MKLSKAQQTVIDKAKRDIDKARAYETFDDYYNAEIGPRCNCDFRTAEQSRTLDPKGHERRRKHWENERMGIALTHCNSATIRKLESLGLIEIIRDSCGDGGYGIDTIRLLNY